jgi:hypothetical protein
LNRPIWFTSLFKNTCEESRHVELEVRSQPESSDSGHNLPSTKRIEKVALDVQPGRRVWRYPHHSIDLQRDPSIPLRKHDQSGFIASLQAQP